MDIKSKITSFFGKIWSFSFLSVLLEKKLESIKKDIETNEESKLFYENKILDAKKTIAKFTQKIEIIEIENKKMKEYMVDINKIFE